VDPRKRQKRAKRLLDAIESAKEVLEAFDLANLADLLRRGEEDNTVDGYRASTRPTGVPGRWAGSSTEAAVFDRQEQHERDPIGRALDEMWATLQECCAGLKRVHHLRQVVVHAGDKLKGRQISVGVCGACGRTVPGEAADARKGEKLRAGYCPRCYVAWRRFARRCSKEGLDASHVVFRAQRRAVAERAEGGASALQSVTPA
jgi:hypothetical protein